MIVKHTVYNGDLIHERFAYKFYGKEINPLGSIVAFVAPMYVNENLIDLEDSINNDYIFSEKAVNFCWEIPNLCPFGAVAFQRLFNTSIASVLSHYISKAVEMDGDDLMVHDKFIGSDRKEREVGKCSVSITYSKNNVAIGHTGINIIAGHQAPGFAYSTNIDEDTALIIMQSVCLLFNNMIHDIHVATLKVIV